ncbi:MAG: transglutaminase family protein [Xanthobacteraceae bacterium]
MRLHIAHETIYRYDTPAKSAIELLRLTPRNHDGQFVVRWRIDVSEDCRLQAHEDAFGNLTHNFTADGPLTELRVGVTGEVETQNTAGVINGTLERFPPSLFLRETPLTKANAPIIGFAEDAARAADDPLGRLHALQSRIHESFTFDPDPTHPATSAAEAFALRRGVCQDYAHVFIAAARHLEMPARYIGGYFLRADGENAQQAGHAWAEAQVPDLGWVAFDPTNGISATDAHVRVAVGLDYLGAAPIRGTRFGGTGETMAVSVHVDQAARQTQS